MATKVTRIAVGINNENNADLYKMLLRLINAGKIKETVFDLLISSFKVSVFKEMSAEEVMERVSRLPEDFDYERVRHWVADSGSLQLIRAVLSLECRLSLAPFSPEDMKVARKTQAIIFFILKNIPFNNSQKNREPVKRTPHSGITLMKNFPASNS